MPDLTLPSRRGFITGLAALIAAPAIVRPASLMPIRVDRPDWVVDVNYQSGYVLTINGAGQPLHVGDIIEIGKVKSLSRYDRKIMDIFRQFVITSEVNKGQVCISLYPPISPIAYGDRYATVDASPQRGDIIRKISAHD